MAEYIDREAFKKEYLCLGYLPEMSETEFDKFPSSDVAPVRHGKWVDALVRDWRCSECGKQVPKQVHFDGYCYDDKLPYCPNCGADMRGSNDE